MKGVTVETSFYIIKPEAMECRETIRRMIEAMKLTITDSFIATIPKWAVGMLYPDLSLQGGLLWELSCEHLVGQQCEVGIVTGDRAIERLLIICGRETDPRKCLPETVRGVFGQHFVEIGDGRKYWLNAIHRPKDENEAIREATIVTMLRAAGP